MNLIQGISSQPWIECFGWTLVHFLWQGVLIAVLYAGARKCMARTSSPNLRYLLACSALTTMISAPLVTWEIIRPTSAIPEVVYQIRSIPPSPSTLTVATALPVSVLTTVSSAHSGKFLPWVVIGWLLGAAAFWVRLVGGWVIAARMRSISVRRAPPEWQQVLQKLSARIGHTQPVRLLVSALVQVPTVVGWLRPVVLVPVGAFSGLPPEQIEALLLHELAHIRRYDYLVNILQSVAEALLFYHPTVWWVSGHIRMERELCCDDVAVSVSGDNLTYARALAQLEFCRPEHLNAAVSANGGSLARRIARLLGQPVPAGRTGLGPGIFAIAAVFLVGVYGLFGQSAHPAFQVASVQRNAPEGRQGTSVRLQPGGRLTTENASLRLLVQFAYTVEEFQVVGGPAWINSDGYAIEAKPEGQTDRKEMWLMLQTLLAERFKLAVHRDTREHLVYTLTAANGGLKLPPSKDGGCIPRLPDAPSPPLPLGPGQVYCGGFRVAMLPTGMRAEGIRISMAQLSKNLAKLVGWPVLDKTGFSGTFDVHLDFTSAEHKRGFLGDFADSSVTENPNWPNIFAALEEQLGLKLTSSNGVIDVLVIDHVERPTAN